MSALWSRANWQPQSRGSRALLGYWKHCSNTQQPPPPHCITISDNVVITFEILCGRYVPSFFDYSLSRTQRTRPGRGTNRSIPLEYSDPPALMCVLSAFIADKNPKFSTFHLGEKVKSTTSFPPENFGLLSRRILTIGTSLNSPCRFSYSLLLRSRDRLHRFSNTDLNFHFRPFFIFIIKRNTYLFLYIAIIDRLSISREGSNLEFSIFTFGERNAVWKIYEIASRPEMKVLDVDKWGTVRANPIYVFLIYVQPSVTIHRPIKLHQNLIESISFLQYRIRVFPRDISFFPWLLFLSILSLSIEIVTRLDFDRKRIRRKIRSELKS